MSEPPSLDEEALGWLSTRCDLETTPVVVFQNITLAHGNATNGPEGHTGVGGGGGGGAIAMRGGQFKAVNVTFTHNTCMSLQSGGGAVRCGAVRLVGQRATSSIVNSSLSGNQGANGGAISSLGASLQVISSLLAGNDADEGGPGVFFVSNDRTGALTIRDTLIVDNAGENFYTAPYRDLFYLGARLTISVSTVE